MTDFARPFDEEWCCLRSLIQKTRPSLDEHGVYVTKDSAEVTEITLVRPTALRCNDVFTPDKVQLLGLFSPASVS